MSGLMGRGEVFVINGDLAIYKALCRIGKGAGFSAIHFSNTREFFLWVEANLPDQSAASLAIVMEAQVLAEEREWYFDELISSIPKVCIGTPKEIAPFIDFLKPLEVQFIQRPFSLKELRETVASAFMRYQAIVQKKKETHLIAETFSKLSRRENEVFRLVGSGHTNQEIADLLGISIKTVKVHRSNVMKKTHSGTIADLIRNYEKHERVRSENNPLPPTGEAI